MDKYKLRTGAAKTYDIDSSLTIRMGEAYPYFRQGKNGKSIYAVCPGCDGPIQICGFFKNTAEAGRKPYGKHVMHDIPDLARYDEADYYNCPYSNRFWTAKNFKKIDKDNERVRKIKQFILDNYDRIIYVLQRDCDMRFSKNAIEHFLTSYLYDTAWDYRNTRAHNIPWVIAEAEQARPILGQMVLIGSCLYNALSESGMVSLEPVDTSLDYARINKLEKTFLDMYFHFPKHYFKRSDDGEHVEEFLEFVVYTKAPPNHNIVFRKTIKVDSNRFAEFCEKKSGNRQQWILDIAKRHIRVNHMSQ